MPINQLINHLQAFDELSEPLKNFLKQRVKTVHYKKNEIIYKQDEKLQKVFFINKGLVIGRTFIEERSHVCWFLKELDFIEDHESFIEHKNARQTAIAVEDSELLWLSYQDLHTIKNIYPEFNFIQTKLLEHYHIYDNKRTQLLMILNCQDRYNKFIEYFDWANQRLKRKHIASYLEMAPGTLSKL